MTTNIRGSDNFDTALYPPDVSPNAWHIALGSTTAFTVTDSTLTFDTVVHKGGNLTLDGGKITVSVAGMYLISFAGSRYQTTDDVWDWSIGLNSGEIANTRDSTSLTIPVQLAAGDVVFIQGKGYCYGTPSNGMTFFTGVRLGV